MPKKTKNLRPIADSSNPSLPTQTLETSKPKTFIREEKPVTVVEPTPKKRRWPYAVLGFLLIFFIVIFSAAFVLWSQVNRFEQAAQVSAHELVPTLRQAWNYKPFADRDNIHILMLGLDEARNRTEGTMLTDTIMLVTINENGRVTLLSLPRDLWIDSLKTKINSLYYYGEESEETTGINLVAQVVEEVTGIKPDYHLVMNMESVRHLVNAINGVEVEVERGFTDTKFPREDVDLVSTSSPELLYQTVTFEPGKQELDGERALQFMRSRQSDDEVEGNDMARTKRQQKVIQAMMAKLRSEFVIKNPEILGRLYRVWHDDLNTNIDDITVLALVKNLGMEGLSLETLSIPVQDDDNAGVLINPPISKHDQWVYEPLDPTWVEFRTWIANHHR